MGRIREQISPYIGIGCRAQSATLRVLRFVLVYRRWKEKRLSRNDWQSIARKAVEGFDAGCEKPKNSDGARGRHGIDLGSSWFLRNSLGAISIYLRRARTRQLASLKS